MKLLNRASWFTLSSVGPVAISFLSLPLLTLRLGSTDYGVFALGVAVGTVVPMIANHGTLSLFSGRLASTQAPKRLVGTAFVASLILAAAIGLFLLACFELMGLEFLPRAIFWLSIITGMLSATWTVAADYLIASGNG